MPGRLEWSPDFEIGIPAIDLQHHYFVELINRLDGELRSVDDRRYLTACLDELAKYAHFHFVSEENLMWRLGYPQLEQHRRHHIDLIDTMSARLGLFQAGTIDGHAVTDFLVDWFVHHTVHEDRDIGRYQREQAAR